MRSAQPNKKPGTTIALISWCRLELAEASGRADAVMDRNNTVMGDGDETLVSCLVVKEGQLTSTNRFYHKHHRRQ